MQSTDFADIDSQCFYGCFSKCTTTNNKESGHFSDKKRMIIMWPIFVLNERERGGGSKWLNIFLVNSLLTPYIYTSYFKDQKRINVSEYQKKKILVHFVVSRNLKCFRCFDSRFSRPCVLFWR